jgi:alpha-soluble NSF attachment protein
MPSKSPAQTLLDKADKKFNSSTGWFSSSSTKFEEAGDLYQQAANSYKLDKLFKEAGDTFAKEAECREKCNESNEAANAWWNAAKAYKRGFPDRESSLHKLFAGICFIQLITSPQWPSKP